MRNVDILIIGGGPVGLWSASYASYRQLKVVLVEKNQQVGGLPLHIYPSKILRDIPGIDKITGKDLISFLTKKIENDNIDVLKNTTIDEVKKIEGGYESSMNNGEIIRSKVILITQGNGLISPRKLDATLIGNPNIHYIYEDLNTINKDVLISGGSDSAIDAVNSLLRKKYQGRIYICHRRNEFRVNPLIIEKLFRNKNVSIITPYKITKISGNGSESQVEMTHTKNGSIKTIIVSNILIQHGFTIQRSNITFLDLEMEKTKYKTNSFFESSMEGVYVVGILSSQQNYNLISIGIGNATTAISNMVEKRFSKRTPIYTN